MNATSPIELDAEVRQKELEVLVTSNGWKHLLQYLASRITQAHNIAMNWELNAQYRAHVLSQEAAFLEFLRYAYTEAQVEHPFDEELTAFFGRIERKLRTPQPQVLQGKVEVHKDPPPRRLRRGAGSIA